MTAIAPCRCPDCGEVHVSIALLGQQGTLAEAHRALARGDALRAPIAVCSQCGAFLSWDGETLAHCDEASAARSVPAHLFEVLRRISDRVRHRRMN